MNTVVFVGVLTGMLVIDFILRSRKMVVRDPAEFIALALNGAMIVWGFTTFFICLREIQ